MASFPLKNFSMGGVRAVEIYVRRKCELVAEGNSMPSSTGCLFDTLQHDPSKRYPCWYSVVYVILLSRIVITQYYRMVKYESDWLR